MRYLTRTIIRVFGARSRYAFALSFAFHGAIIAGALFVASNSARTRPPLRAQKSFEVSLRSSSRSDAVSDAHEAPLSSTMPESVFSGESSEARKNGALETHATALGEDGSLLSAPAYPAAARRFGQEGVVVLRFFVNEDGVPERVEAISSSGYPLLDAAAVTHVQTEWRFPKRRGSLEMTARIEFALAYTAAVMR